MKEETPKLQNLSKQDEVFVHKVVETGKLTKSAQEAYDIGNARYATQKALRQVAKDSIIQAIEVKRETLKSALEKQGITPDYIAGKINILLKATDKDGNNDYTAIDKGIKHSTNIYGVADEIEKPKQQNTYNFIFNPEVQEKVKIIEAEIKNQLIQKHVQEN